MSKGNNNNNTGSTPTLYLGPLTVTNNSANFGGVSVVNVNSITVTGLPLQSNQLVNKQYVDEQITSLATERLDAILTGSSLNLDSLVEIVDYFNGLDSAASGNVSLAVSNVQNSVTAEAQRASNAEIQLQTNIDAEEQRARNAETQLQSSIYAEVQRANSAEIQLQSKIDVEEQRAKDQEAALAATAALNKQTTLCYWSPNPFKVSGTEIGIFSSNKPKALNNQQIEDGWKFIGNVQSNDVTVRVLNDNTVFDSSLNSPNILVFDNTEILVKLSEIATVDSTTNNTTYLTQSNWKIIIKAGGSLNLFNASVVFEKGIAHKSNQVNAISIGDIIESIGDPIVISSDILTNAMVWDFVPKLKPTPGGLLNVSVRMQLEAGVLPSISVDFGNNNVNTYKYGGDLALIPGGYFTLRAGQMADVADAENEPILPLIIDGGNSFEIDALNAQSRIVKVRLHTSTNSVASFNVNEIGITSSLGSERMALESSAIAIDDAKTYSSVTRTRLDALYQYFKRTDSSVDPTI